MNVPFRWIRLSWLLFLQLAVVACLAMALGRPIVSGDGGSTASAILMIDRSASMASLDGSAEGVTRFRIAQERAREILDRLPSETRVLIAGFGASASAVTGFTRDRGMARAAVAGLEPTDEPGDLDRAFELVRALSAQSSEAAEAESVRLFLLSDGGFEQGAGQGGLGQARLEFVRIAGDASSDNIGIVAIGARRDYEDPATVRLFVRLQSNVDREVVVPVECRLGAVVIAQQSVTIPAAPTDAPADASASFEFGNTEGGLVTVLIGRADDLESDNIAGLVLRPQTSLRILLVRPNIAVDAMDEVVRAALDSLAPARLRVVNAGEYEQKGADADDDLIVFDRVRPTRAPIAPSISFGATIPVPGLGVSGAEESADPTGFIYWLRSHPIMRYVVLNDVWVARPMVVTLPEASAGGAEIKSVALATGERGPLLVLVEQGGVRRVVVGFDVGQSNWLKDASFHIFLKNAVDFLTLSGEEDSGLVRRTTETFSVRPAAASRSIEVRGPVSFSRELVTPAERVSIGPLARVGVYEITGVQPEDAVAAVNLLDPIESRAAAVADLSLPAGDVRATTAADAAPREIWPWFVLGAFALLCVEWMLYASRMRV